MDDIDIPEPNKALAAILLSSRMRTLVWERTELARTRWRAVVAKRSGRLAASARVKITYDGVKHDRPIGTLIVGEGLAYGAAHEFGHGFTRTKSSGQFTRKSGKRRRGVVSQKQAGAKELRAVLKTLRKP